MKKHIISFLLIFFITGVLGCASAPPIIQASLAGDAARVTSLIASGADVNVADSNGGTALYWATYRGSASVVRELLAAGADPNIRTRGNSTPLELAASRGGADKHSDNAPGTWG